MTKEEKSLYSKEYYIRNKEKKLEYQKRYKILNSEKVKEYQNRYSDQNKELRKEYKKKYRDLNKDKIKEYNKSYESKSEVRDRIKKNYKIRMNDPIFNLKERIRNRIRTSLKVNGFSKNSNTQEIVGCSFDFFKDFIESKFLPGMCWDNRSEWHIDHIIPVSFGKTEDEVYRLNHYTNLQPLWAKDNLKKSNILSSNISISDFFNNLTF